LTPTYINPANLGTLRDIVDVRFSVRLRPGAMVSVHRDRDFPHLAVVAIDAHVRFRLPVADCAAVARIADIALGDGYAAIELSTGQGFYLYRHHSPGYRRGYYRLCLGSPLRKTIRENEVLALSAVLTYFSSSAEGNGA
jgi:hypothetical protein